MTDLSQDELTVLLIANEGDRMMPIGRWGAPSRSLLARGYLQPNPSPQDPTGNFNLTITAIGRQAVTKDEDDTARQMIEANNNLVTGKQQARSQAEAIAVQMVDLVELSIKVTGGSRQDALRRWSDMILVRAQELMR